MKAADLSPDERSFLIEAADFEQEFWELIGNVHWNHEEFALPDKFALAQSVARRLLVDRVMRCMLVRYDEITPGRLEIRDSVEVPPDRVFAHWSNPFFWSRGCGAELLGYEGDNRHARVLLEPTELGEAILDEIFDAGGHKTEKDEQGAQPPGVGDR